MVAVLFARSDSVYKTMPGLDVYDKERDARNFPGGVPVVAHPPCRAWGRLRHFAKPRHDEKDLGIFAVAMVRRFGGVLEHPAFSTLWDACKLPAPGESIGAVNQDEFGGWTLPVQQYWWGHRAEKATWLYIVGRRPADVVIPMVLGEAPCVVSSSGRDKSGNRSKRRPEIKKAEREHTPPEFARWLVDLAAGARL